MKTKENTAIKPYMNAHADALELAAELSQLLEDCEAPSERTNWGHVGSLNEANRQLKQAIDFIKEFNGN